MVNQRRPHDWQERHQALDIQSSFIVQAPAGSGKTELLVQRILSLLAVVEKPEEVLSITFTRKAAAEMRLRLLACLERAENDDVPSEPYAKEVWLRGRAVRQRDREKGWNLLKTPARLQILTIDSFCAHLCRRMPWLSRFGEQPAISDQPEEMYLKAAESTLARLERGDRGADAIELLLVHLDNRLGLLRDLIVAMLSRRDQWLRHLMTKRHEQARQVLEDGLKSFVGDYLDYAYQQIGRDLWENLVAAARYAFDNMQSDGFDPAVVSVQGVTSDHQSLKAWRAMTQIFLTSAGDVRKSLNKNQGFPAGKNEDAAKEKARALAVLDSLRAKPLAAAAFMGVQSLPEISYTANQWRLLEALIELLPIAVTELQDVFRQHGQVDFIEVAIAAHKAIGSTEEPEELLLQLDSRISHILVDEFQDTSHAQYELLQLLTAGWERDDGRTLFLVGDPMQSIYRFREADVGLYLRVSQRGLKNQPIEKISLRTNFRSTQYLVNWVNDRFHQVFPEVEDIVTGAVRYSAATAFTQSTAATNVAVQTWLGRQDDVEADKVVELVKQARTQRPDDMIAVLVRSRNHLEAIVPALKSAGIAYQAQDVDCLADRPVTRDILSLVRAIQHPADRIAWLSLLRAPWCGLSLDDLHQLCAGDSRKTVWQLLNTPADQIDMFAQISPEGQERLDRVVTVLEKALANFGRLPVRQIIESSWLALGGPACVDQAALVDAQRAFELLGEFGTEAAVSDVEKRLNKLFAAPDPEASANLQLMTIHKAKGLEFDTVIIPGLGRGVRGSERTLLRWIEPPDQELLLAPIPSLSKDSVEPTYNAIGHIHKEQETLEATRLFYVAVTRARSHLHLLGHLNCDANGEKVPTSGSFMSILWPSCRDELVADCQELHKTEAAAVDLSAIRRLPASWRLPQLDDLCGPDIKEEKTASLSGHYRNDSFRSRLVDEGRVIGNVVHQWLERIVQEGLEGWTVDIVVDHRAQFIRQLGAEGVPASRLSDCASTVEKCLVNTLSSDRGRWLLSAHKEVDTELELNGVIEAQLVRAAIDLTFVDDDDCRWVVDYKTSSPSGGETVDEFLATESQRYQHQLRTYSRLMSDLKPRQRVRAALYFPMIDAWAECTPFSDFHQP